VIIDLPNGWADRIVHDKADVGDICKGRGVYQEVHHMASSHI
jgi:hypothetical protein